MDILAEPVSGVYMALLRLASSQCATFSLMWREDLLLGPSAYRVSEQLARDILSEERVFEWPGTRVLGEPKLLRRYRVTALTIDVLLEAPGFYAWRAPERPEDLALYTPDGAVWLGSVAHEGAAFFGVGGPGKNALESAVPGLFVRKRRQ